MYSALQKELDTFVRRTPKSAEAHKKNLKRIPLGVAFRWEWLAIIARTILIRSLLKRRKAPTSAISMATITSITIYVLAR